METPEVTKATYVCAIGASAGGLRPLEEFFDGAQPGLNVGYVVIQDLSPDDETTMETLLSRHTTMPVNQAIDGAEVQGDHIYLIPPNVDMSVFGGRLRLRDRPERGPSPRPITIFFQSLASDYNDKSIAVVLSGTGSDGSEGIVSVHQSGGLTLTQDSSAEFGDMPDRAEATGEVDVMLAPREMASSISDFVSTGARPSSAVAASGLTTDERLLRAYDVILDGHFVGGVLLNEQCELVHTFGTASEWMSPPTGRPSLDIFQLIDDPLLGMAISAIVRALREDADDITARPVTIQTSKGSVNTSLIGQRLNVGTVAYHLVHAAPAASTVELDHQGPSDTGHRAEKQLRAVARATSLALLIQSGDDSVDVDDRYRRLTGFELDARFRSVHPDDRERTLEALDRRDAVIPCRLHLADGSWRHVEFRCIASGNEAITVVVDIHLAVEATAKLTADFAQLHSQMEHRTSTLQSSVSNLAERNADLDSFAHAAAHDLKAPLRAMMAFSELAAEAIGEEHAARPFLARIEQSSARMASMVDSLLQLASAGRDALATRRCLVEPILQQVKNDLSHEIEQAGALFEVSELDPVLADPTALGVILTNLLANSVKYRSERTPRISISSTTDEGDVIITIADNGIGFDQVKAIEIFEPFRRLHSRDQFEGSGVGLAICRRLASRLDGEIWATADVNEGTAVSLRLPSPGVDA